MTEIHQIDLTKKSLAAMPDAERRLFLLLGHAINVLQKLVLMSGQGTYAPTFVDHVQAEQTLILMRTLIGKLSEVWASRGWRRESRLICGRLCGSQRDLLERGVRLLAYQPVRDSRTTENSV